MDCNPPGSSVHGILQARILEWVAVPSSRGSSWPRDRMSLAFPALAGRFVTNSTTWELPNGSQCRSKNNAHGQPAAPSTDQRGPLSSNTWKAIAHKQYPYFPGTLAPFSTKLYPCWIYYWSDEFWVLERAKFLNNSLKFLKSHEIDNHCEWQSLAQ